MHHFLHTSALFQKYDSCDSFIWCVLAFDFAIYQGLSVKNFPRSLFVCYFTFYYQSFLNCPLTDLEIILKLSLNFFSWAYIDKAIISKFFLVIKLLKYFSSYGCRNGNQSTASCCYIIWITRIASKQLPEEFETLIAFN